MDTMPSHDLADIRSRLGLFLGWSLHVAIWCFVWVWLAAMTEGWLSPWDTAPFRPAIGTWERTTNDFFETSPGAVLPAMAFIAADLALLLTALRSQGSKSGLVVASAALDLVYVVLTSTLAIFAHRLPTLWLAQPRPDLDYGYHLTWPAIVVALMATKALFIAKRLILERHRRSHSQQRAA